MGLAVTLSLVFLWVCLFHFGHQQKIRLSHVCKSHGQQAYTYLRFTDISCQCLARVGEKVVEISYK